VTSASFPVRVFGGIEIAGEPPKSLLERKLLAVLTARRNSSVTGDELADAVWDGKPPATALNTLQSKMSRIRPRFAGTGLSITHSGNGYRFVVPASDCDADEFERRAGAFLHGGIAAPVEFAESALELWRGRPYGEFVSDEFAIAEARRLEQMREEVETHRLRVLLELRRFAEVLVYAEPLLTRPSVGDDICGFKMRALTGLGRYVEATRAFETHRLRLRDETGLSPGPELAALNIDILRVSDAEIVAPTMVSGRPQQTSGALFGRQQVLERAIEALRSSRILTLVGEGGIGKSRLAAEITRHVDRSIWCDVTEVQSEHHFLTSLAAAVGFDPSEPVTVGALADRLGDQDLLVVFDGCEQAIAMIADCVEALVHHASIQVLITSRVPLHIGGEQVIRVPQLEASGTSSPAVGLLIDRARAAGAKVDPTDRTLQSIARQLDGHPLALELVASRLAVLPATEVLRAIETEVGWSQTIASVAARRSLVDVVGLSYSSLDDEAKRLFRALSVFTGSTSVRVIRRLALHLDPHSDPMRTLLTLAERSLVRVEDDESGSLRYRILHPVADVGRRLAEQHLELAALVHTHATVMVQLTEDAASRFPGPDEAAWADAVVAEFANIRAAVLSCNQHGWLDLSARLIGSLSNESRLRERADVEQWALELAQHPDLRLSDRSAQVLSIAAHAQLIRGEWTTAITTANLARRAMVDGATETWSADCVLFQTAVMDRFGEIDDRARSRHAALYAYSERTGDPMGSAIAGFVFAMICADTGQPLIGIGEAIACLRLGRRLKSPTVIAMGLYAVARTRTTLNPSRAIEQLQQARVLAAEGRCTIVDRHATRALLSLTDNVDLRPQLARLAQARDHQQTEQELQEVVGLLIPMIRSGETDLAARCCGGLVKTIWRVTADVRSAEAHLTNLLGGEEYRRLRTEGRRLSPSELVEAVLNLVPDLVGADSDER
jgi:predicted ATPase/DNA-binding SARP family transcriptional activator